MIFGKLSLGGNLIVQLCIFSCKDKAMLGYNVLVMYLRTIDFFLFALKNVKKYHIRRSTFQWGHKKCTPGPLFFNPSLSHFSIYKLSVYFWSDLLFQSMLVLLIECCTSNLYFERIVYITVLMRATWVFTCSFLYSCFLLELLFSVHWYFLWQYFRVVFYSAQGCCPSRIKEF